MQSNKHKEYNLITYYSSTFNCIMSSVIGNKRSELHFIEIGGITSLIFAFEKIPRSLKRICCSILIELMTNKKSVE